jgi:peptide/nickel transport system substrate-binding protein
MNHFKRYRFESLFYILLVVYLIIATWTFGYSETSPSEQNVEQEVEKVHEGGTLTVTCPEHIQTLDPQKAELISERWVIEQIYDGLYEYDPNDQILPELAAGFPERLGDYEYLVRLKPGIKFSDGTDMDANDVVFTFKRLLNPTTQCPARDLFQNVKHIEAITPRTVKITVGPDCPDPSVPAPFI